MEDAMSEIADNRSLAEIHDAIVGRIQELNDHKLDPKEADEAARNLLGYCYKVVEIAEQSDEELDS